MISDICIATGFWQAGQSGAGSAHAVQEGSVCVAFSWLKNFLIFFGRQILPALRMDLLTPGRMTQYKP